ncbi:metallo-beta-lactamase superfamily protein [Grosmannia clavigera kw1407]|uniref:Metallo-beta-lactamase superfamily protein n=1 Tax=Grosmannia clavigera (strain kw1407 / UAMH 11150) TaxID=655863 RepID=F0XCI1_GROCL|nr:metallo-beta-lactamase superfamily protein [Grosmannia clavigera kw1407]EFX04467.1 metallo-beta-lactamase superfamily protein [Grosmannia clavigera kw1407]
MDEQASITTYDGHATDCWLVCTACGTQFPTADRTALPSCIICDDPRQFTPPSGQAFATMGELRRRHHNVFHPAAGGDGRLTSIVTEPKLAIGQRAILVRTPAGNILWDCLTLLDAATIEHIRALGGLRAIVISHPHYFSSHVEWAAAFDCPVYLRGEDRVWAVQQSPHQVFLEGEPVHEIVVGNDSNSRIKTGAKAIRLGGHFPGSQVLLFDGHLLIADTLVTTPAGMGSWTTDALGQPRRRPAHMNSFAFMWSIPNMIPLAADEVFAMWDTLKHHDFTSTHGAFVGLDICADDIKLRVLESMKIQTRFAGWTRQHSWDDV